MKAVNLSTCPAPWDRPLALTPRGFKRETACRLERVTCAYVADSQGDRTLAAAADLARRHKVPLRLVTFVVRDRQMYPSVVGYAAENVVANSWRQQPSTRSRRLSPACRAM